MNGPFIRRRRPASRAAPRRQSSRRAGCRPACPPGIPRRVRRPPTALHPGRLAPGLAAPGLAAPGLATPGPAEDSWVVRIGTDAELRDFALRVLRLADNPKLRRDLIAGRIRFRLAEQPAGAASQAVYRVDKGAVTERAVAAAAQAGARLVLGPRAVLTPLARDKARALGVPIEKER